MHCIIVVWNLSSVSPDRNKFAISVESSEMDPIGKYQSTIILLSRLAEFTVSIFVFQVPELRLLFPNGSLVFPPFPNERYRHDVHSAVYRCKLRSQLGVVVSRDVQVKAGRRRFFRGFD